jgi:eukaryotic-like serine/threonine-protein kinase
VTPPKREAADAIVPFRDGEIIAGKYEMDRVLGKGGMGVVIAAHHVALQQRVAIKMMLPAALSIPGAAERFLREARSTVAIQSEHVARVLDVGTLENGAPFMVMEYLTGSDLGNVLRREGRLSVAVAIDYVLQACEAIAEAHSRGIVHRDLKPDNVFLTRRADGSALIKVLDFGLSKPTRDDGLGSATPSITGSNMVAGSPQYMSPEQVRSLKNVDHRTDLWALGVILYELLVGQRPFDAGSVAGVFAKIAADAPVPPRALRRDLPAALDATILRCLEKDVAHRMRSVAELARCLEPFAPPDARTSIERIVRLGGGQSTGDRPTPAHDASEAPDSLEEDIPTMAAVDDPVRTSPAPPAPAGRSLTPLNLPAPAPRNLTPHKLPAPAHRNLTPHRSATPLELPEPTRAPGTVTPVLELDIKPAHPAERGRPLRKQVEPVKVGDLQMSAPLWLLVLATIIAAADMVAPRVLGHAISVGPVRPLWIAGPLALGGALWLVFRIINR